MELMSGQILPGVGELPIDWMVLSLQDMAQIRSGFAKNSKVSVHDPIRVHYLRVANVQDGYLNLSEINEIEISRASLQKFLVRPGDVLMNEGGDLDKLGRGTIWNGGFGPCVHQNHVFVIRCKKNLLPNFLTYWSASSVAKKYFLTAGKQTTNLASISKTALGELPIVIPSKVEQNAIATTLSNVDFLLEGLNRLIAKKRDIKKATMQQLLTGKKRLPGFTGKWGVKKLGNNIKKIVGGGTPNRSNPKFWGGEVPWVTVKDFSTFHPKKTQESITKIGLKGCASHLIPAGTLIVSTRMALGKAVIYEVDVAINQDLKALFLKSAASVLFLYYWFENNIAVIDDLGSGSTVKGVSIAELQNLLFPHISFTEQAAIASVLSDMDTELQALEKRRAKTQDLKQAMMQELLTGRIRLV